MKKHKKTITLEDYVKAVKRADREIRQDVLGPGFHSVTRVHRSKKLYTRKHKHKGSDLG
ncbi:MAG: hypothetical protein J5814_10750 [Bacteroidaceae bacterium]|nr:hypothetical protein [Bacteroidaceae bacterium]